MRELAAVGSTCRLCRCAGAVVQPHAGLRAPRRSSPKGPNPLSPAAGQLSCQGMVTTLASSVETRAVEIFGLQAIVAALPSSTRTILRCSQRPCSLPTSAGWFRRSLLVRLRT